MQYKLVDVLTTRMVEKWESEVFGNGIEKKPIVSQSAGVVRAAVLAGWYDGEKPDADNTPPKEVIELATKVWQAYGVLFGADTKNLSARRHDTPKE